MCKHYDIPENRYRNRINRGWDIQKALTTNLIPMEKPCKDHLGNEFKSQQDMCAFWGIEEALYRQRIKLGFGLEKALTQEVGTPCTDHLGNQFNSITQMCKHYGISVSTFFSRIKRNNWSLEKALTFQKEKIVDFNGSEFNSLKEMCEHYNVGVETYKRRISFGCSIKEALTLKGKCCNKCYDHLGNSYSNFKEMCKAWNKDTSTVKGRLDNGILLKDALEKDIEHINERISPTSVKSKDHTGREFDSFAEMCAFWKQNPSTVQKRLKKYGFSLQEALIKKSNRKIKSDFDVLCKKNGRSPNFVNQKLKDGFTLDEIFKNKNIGLYSVKDHLGNIYKNKAEMASHYGVSDGTVRARLSRGFDLETALTTPSYIDEARVDHLGNVFKNVEEMCKHHGVILGTFNNRRQKGYSLEEALTNKKYFQFGCTDHNGNSFHSVKDMCAHYGVSQGYYNSQLERGLSQKEALTPIRVYDHNGNEFFTLIEMCAFYGISTNTFYRRREEGMSLKKILTTPYRNAKECEDHEGNKFGSTTEMCNYYGIPANRFKARISKYMFTLEEALTCPLRMSLGEYRVKNILDDKGIKYLHNVTIKTVFKKLGLLKIYADFMEVLLENFHKEFEDFSVDRLKRLRYDFTLLENNDIHSFIEYDGEQHFKFVKIFFDAFENFLCRNESDIIKNCISNYGNIPLLRIRYDQVEHCEEMIEDLLNNPNKYIEVHNTYLSESEYWSIFEAKKQKLLAS